jgi:hypothetical protein
MMRRRAFITLLGGAAAASPFGARAQQGDRLRRIGMLIGYAEEDPETKSRLVAFRQRLEKRGWQAMNTEKTNGESTPPAITSFSPARSAASSPRKSPMGSPLTIVPSVLQRSRT